MKVFPNFLLSGDLIQSKLFHTILSFCSMLAQNFFCVMMVKFEQSFCWTMTFPATGYYQRNTYSLSKIKITDWWPNVVQTTLHWLFSCAMLSGASWTTLHIIFSVQCCPGKVKTLYWVLTCAMCPKSINTTSNRIFSCVLLSGASRITMH